MLHSAINAFVLLFLMDRVNVSLTTEPVCSKFDYEEKLLEKMIRTEVKVEAIESEIVKTQDSVLNTLNEIKKKVVDINDRFEDLRNNITEEMIAKTKDLEKNEEEIARPSVAFYAHHVTDLALDVTDEIIVFDTIVTNEGSGYEKSTGIFTAPVGGLYQFTGYVCAQTGKYSFVGLSLAGKVVAAATNYDSGYYTCSSVGAVVRVKSGEEIWMKCTLGHNSAYRLFQDQFRMNTFSGILLNK
ncbi:complement C1q-like protein 3 isoform X2 [Mercenaria mercenaria]|uniref:complement C1q-like protein 3 isoform X2 n=1 Tax=Mercenaria mercenaria TaxID=6596 RepID=UPI00234F4DCF|nr:complement C1q-like protein 3 isoform X2 [Mercenaria mercenaria]